VEELLNKLQSRVRTAIERIEELKRSNDDLLRLNRSLAEDNELLNSELEDKAAELAGVEELQAKLAAAEERRRAAADKLGEIIAELDAILELPPETDNDDIAEAPPTDDPLREVEEGLENYDDHPRVVPPTDESDPDEDWSATSEAPEAPDDDEPAVEEEADAAPRPTSDAGTADGDAGAPDDADANETADETAVAEEPRGDSLFDDDGESGDGYNPLGVEGMLVERDKAPEDR